MTDREANWLIGGLVAYGLICWLLLWPWLSPALGAELATGILILLALGVGHFAPQTPALLRDLMRR